MFRLSKSSGFIYFQFAWKIYETMSNTRTAISHSNTPSENKNDDNTNHTENFFEFLQGESSVEPKKSNSYYKTNSSAIPRFFFFWDIYWTSKNPICRIAIKHLWKFLMRRNWSWKWTFTMTNLMNYWSCKSIFTKTTNGM